MEKKVTNSDIRDELLQTTNYVTEKSREKGNFDNETSGRAEGQHQRVKNPQSG